ncbi:sensor histidine kinase [Vibrio sp. RM-69-4]|uniref:ATP-binding protein n=1 Tax=Vibrio sp. RM-69-4 TaxID=2950157 RepID=UPI00215C204A|nr:sensor histidine kinase [Vibrio sp. RM-69-4]MCR9421764.1 sensor histidine kinase [Vibrio sp. RM-69-4]
MRTRLLYLLITLTAVLGQSNLAHGQEQTLQDRWQHFLRQAESLSAARALPLQSINSYPVDLLLSASAYPDFSRYSWQTITELKAIASQCALSPGLSKTLASRPELQKAASFELALCQGDELPIRWFKTAPFLHPAGGSYAERYLAFSTHNITAEQNAELQPYTTLSNPHHPLYTFFTDLETAGRDALVSGYRAYIDRQQRLWISGDFGIRVLSALQWKKVALDQQLVLSAITAATQSCQLRYSNLCVSSQEKPNISLWVSVILLLLLATTLSRTLWLRRQQAKEKRFILQLLTHELRTPITSLGLTVEQFRQQFDTLPELAQDTFGRLLADHQRLAQLAQTSKGFLSSDPNEPFQCQTAYLSDWLDHCVAKHELSYELTQDIELTLPYYWLGICLDNLIRNAKQHGQGTISITASVTDTQLRLCVSDEGEFPSRLKRLFSRSRTASNMGIGLRLVSHLMLKMGGKLTCKAHPTRCQLELPL